MTKQNKILNEFEQIEKNLNLCKNPNFGVSAFIIKFECENFMLYFNEIKTLVKKCNFAIYDIETDYATNTISLTITAKGTATTSDKFNVKTFLDWAFKNEFITMFI